MSNISTQTIVRFAGIACIVAGTVALLVAAKQFTIAADLSQLSQPGAIMSPVSVDPSIPNPSAMIRTPLHGAAPAAAVVPQTAVGMLLILAGLGFLTLWHIRHSRCIQVHGTTSQAHRRGTRRTRAYWISMEVW